MDCQKTGALIRTLRLERQMTQQQLASQLGLSHKTVSKWERGLGCPDLSVLGQLSRLLGVDLDELLEGELSPNPFVGGNMKKNQYFVCPVCGNLVAATGGPSVSCCGRRLEPLSPQKAQAPHSLVVEPVETDWYLTTAHPMDKDHFLTFVALATGDRLQLVKTFPQWDLQVRFPRRGHGMLLFHCNRDGLFYQLV